MRGPMPCVYPHGEPSDWCERHARDHAMIQGLNAAAAGSGARAA